MCNEDENATENATENLTDDENEEEWVIGSVVCKGKRCAVVRKVTPTITAFISKGGVLVGTQAMLMLKGWRIKIKGSLPRKREY